MKVVALLLTLLAASANAQDVGDPCHTEMTTLEDCLKEDASERCKNCVSEKYESNMVDQPDGDQPPINFKEVMTTIVDECKAQEDTCKACSSYLDTYIACAVEKMPEIREYNVPEY
eukprot:CAMPEP_0172572730 /NCGR_PEP_ID=MMETSP1067-20121228/135827_1 /TAXON_ID=265564 ORGANISM="Thalassiosira punctigera, Strain Tpunct2005C2" /NCGR_SAMPLE_ID=MMETSP1067 /ASSEMBLY_ACC=CAM_ASM_000444 /LENGTH=115 /DNA_ID=CAMNT_0013365313 /DNA_START=29 /DNA_END=376 /DNA_ORIENTATION=+